MKRVLFLAWLLGLGALGAAEKPWERKLQLPVPLAVELPTIPPTNPFFTPLQTKPQPKQTPLREDFPTLVPATAAVYIDTTGTCRRVKPLSNPLPGVLPVLSQELLETHFTPGKSFGKPAAVWVDVGADFRGKVKEARVVQLQVKLPEPALPPVPEATPLPPGHPGDGQLLGTPLNQLEAFPVPKRFSASVPGQRFRQSFRLMAEVGTDGKVKRVVFLSCPEGLRAWLLASTGGWSFSPPQGTQGPVTAWVELEGVVEVEMGTLRTEGLRVSRTSSYPEGGGAGATPPPGG